MQESQLRRAAGGRAVRRLHHAGRRHAKQYVFSTIILLLVPAIIRKGSPPVFKPKVAFLPLMCGRMNRLWLRSMLLTWACATQT